MARRSILSQLFRQSAGYVVIFCLTIPMEEHQKLRKCFPGVPDNLGFGLFCLYHPLPQDSQLQQKDLHVQRCAGGVQGRPLLFHSHVCGPTSWSVATFYKLIQL